MQDPTFMKVDTIDFSINFVDGFDHLFVSEA